MSSRAASAVAKAGCDTVAEIASLGREHFGSRPNLGVRSLAELEKLAGWPPKRMSAVDTVTTVLRLAIGDPEEAREVAGDVLMALRRSGFTVSTRPR